MTPGPTRKQDDTSDDVGALMLAIAVIAAGGGWLLYRHVTKNPALLHRADTPITATAAAATLIAVISGAVIWRATHPGPASASEPEKWALTLPAITATIGTGSAAFAVTAATARWLLTMPTVAAMMIAAAAGLAGATFNLDTYRAHRARLQLRTTLIQALYTPLGHKQPSANVLPTMKWDDLKSQAPQTITIRAARPLPASTSTDDNRLVLDLDTAGPASRRPDPTTTIRNLLRAHCHAHYRVSADPSSLVFTATQFVPEHMDEELADLTRKARDIFDSSATVTGSIAEGFTIKHAIAKKLTGEFRKRVAEQNLTELVGGTWRVKWDMPNSAVTFAPKPQLPHPVYPAPVPAVTSISEAIGHYKHTRFAYGVDLDLGVQEWDPLDSPHTLVVGKTGAGKTVYLRTLIAQASRRGWAVVLVDFKGGSYSDFVGWPNVHIISSDPFESIATIHRMYTLMDDRNARARWDQSEWDDNLPYLVIVDEAAQFSVILNRLWNSSLKPKDGPKDCPTLTELNEMARLSRTARVHLVMGMQRPDHTLIDTESRDNFGNRVSVGPISRIAAEMAFEDSYTGRYVPRIKGRGMSTGTHQDPRETQYYFTPAANSTDPREAEIIARLRPPIELIPRYVPEMPTSLSGIKWNDIAAAPWFPLSQRPDLDPVLFRRKVTDFVGDSRLGFDITTDSATADRADMHELTVAPCDLQPNDIVSFTDGRIGEVDGIDVDDDGQVAVMWQDDEDGRLCISTLDPGERLSVHRSSS